jgi:hypothetical protein
MEYKCIECKKTYSGYQSLWIHNKKYHAKDGTTAATITPIIDTKIDTNPNICVTKPVLPDTIVDTNVKNKKYSCKFCDKKFNFRQNKYQHEERCKNKKSNLEEDKMAILEENKKLKEENEKLKSSQLVPLNNTNNNTNNKTKNKINHGVITNNHGTINNNQNNTLNKNNYLYINQIGNEKMDLTAKEIKSIVNDGLNGAMTCIRNLNFNAKKPENHSFYSSSLEGQFCTAINQKTQKPETLPKKEVVDRALESSFKILEGVAIQIECDEDFKDQFTKEEIDQLQNIINNKTKFYEKKNRKIFHNSVIGMSYTFKNLILSTWELLQPDYDEDMDETESLPDITEIHYDPNDILGKDDSDEEFTYKISFNKK